MSLADPTHSLSGFQPALVLEVELGEPLPAVTAYSEKTGRYYQRAVALVRLWGQPLGIVELTLPPAGLSAGAYADEIGQRLQHEITACLQDHDATAVDGLTDAGISRLTIAEAQRGKIQNPSEASGISVVVATHDRTESLARCLESLEAMCYPTFEIIVVDNVPSTDETAEFIKRTYGQSEQIKYVREDGPGLARAHNCGLHEVRFPLVAFTDDDVLVDKYWLNALASGFAAAENVGCVTGMIFPAELETPSQMWIEQSAGFSKGFGRALYDMERNRPSSPLFPYAAGMFGSGANMAFRADVLREMGGFDPALGAGSQGVGGDDLAAFFDVIVRGHTLVYEPSAIVFHHHHREYDRLRRQAHGYGVGLTAYLTRILMERPDLWLDFASKIPDGIKHALKPDSAKNSKKPADYPPELTRLERLGMLRGPLAYVRSRHDAATRL